MEQKGGKVVIVDDREEGGPLSVVLGTMGIDAKVIHPENVRPSDLSEADVVLVDFELSAWTSEDQLADVPVSRIPVDGLALAAVLQRYLNARSESRPVAFAILTGQIGVLARPIIDTNREHTLARLSNVEWVFRKVTGSGESELAGAVASLTGAVRRLPTSWPRADDGGAVEALLTNLLGVKDDHPRRGALLEAVFGCNPPVHELSQWSHGMAVVRWLLHRILPYPTFLWSEPYLAARLCVSRRWLQRELAEGRQLAGVLGEARYVGVLHDFGGPRWWRSEVEALLWKGTSGKSFNRDAVRGWLASVAGGEPDYNDVPNQPVVCVNTDFAPVEDFGSMDACLRVVPDDWPQYADNAWVSVTQAKGEPRLRAVVHRDDVGRLDE